MDSEKLINLVKANECLYNKKKGDFHIKQKKMAAWEGIARKMGISENQCIRRWTTLRDRYTKLCRTGQEEDGEGWHLFDAMNFLQKHVRQRRSRINSSNTDENIIIPDMIHRTKDFSFQNSPAKIEFYDITNDTDFSVTTKKTQGFDDQLEHREMNTITSSDQRCKEHVGDNIVVEGFKTMIGGLLERMPLDKQASTMKKVLDVILEDQD